MDNQENNTANKKATKRRTGLGKGLNALLGDTADNASVELPSENKKLENTPTGNADFSFIVLAEIETNPFQPRKNFKEEQLEELAESIRLQGVLQPITVRRLAPNQYQLISGERRLRASKLAGLENIPAYIKKATDQDMLEWALIENIQREDLDPIEVALSYQRLMTECDITIENLGNRVGKKRSTVNNALRLLKLPTEIQEAIRDKQLTAGHARAIINIENIDQQLFVFNKIIKDGLSVRAVEDLVRKLKSKPDNTEQKTNETPQKPEDIKQVEKQLTSHFGSRVNIKLDKDNKGELKINFVSKDDLNRILELLNI